jgi:pimeloyl-ACP methyl ester carboxylesterase
MTPKPALALRREALSIPNRQGLPMYAVVTRPAGDAEPREVLLFCQAGLQNKTGAGDYFRWLGDQLSGRGATVVRFDQTGTGDSPGEIGDDLELDRYFIKVQSGVSTDDTLDALRWARRTYPGARLYLWGQCGGCISALLACAREPQAVDGLVLLALPVLFSQQLEVVREHDAQVAWIGYLQKLTRPQSYLRLLRGQSEYHLIKAALLSATRNLRKHVLSSVESLRGDPVPDHPQFNHHLWEAFQEVMRQHKPVLLLMARLDNETPEFDDEFKAKVLDHRPAYRKLCSVRYLEQADHSLMLQEGRESSRDAILKWLAAR